MISIFLRYSGILGGFLCVFLPIGLLLALSSDVLGIFDLILDGYIYLSIIVFLFLFLGTIDLYRYFRQKNKKTGKIGSITTSIGFLIVISILIIGFTDLQNPFSIQNIFIISYIAVILGSILIGISTYKTNPYSKLTPTFFATSIPLGTTIGWILLIQGHGYIPLIIFVSTLYGAAWILISYKTTQN